jgi:hypothetical protein
MRKIKSINNYYIRKDINMSKYLELVEGSFTQEHLVKQQNQKPYVAYSIKDNDIIYSIKRESPYKMVDLGLSVKWADRNVGASSPEDAGLYFQWGDIIGYTADQVGKDKVFDWNNYKFGTFSNLTKYNSTDNLTVLKSADDAATVHMGSQYRMPTKAEINELIEYTTQSFIDLDGNVLSQEDDVIDAGNLKGVKFTSKTVKDDNNEFTSIFIPAAGSCDGSLLNTTGMYGRLWSSSLDDVTDDSARCLELDYGYILGGVVYERYIGMSIRGVQA